MRRGWRIYVNRRKNNTVEPSLTAVVVVVNLLNLQPVALPI